MTIYICLSVSTVHLQKVNIQNQQQQQQQQQQMQRYSYAASKPVCSRIVDDYIVASTDVA